ncbi:MAG: A/G-specific adenine glycosylase [Deltaproteobacteria bacterium]|nr:MAG: A/G-specific adenine glycosylase [Deltaproteobacteria bacterium]
MTMAGHDCPGHIPHPLRPVPPPSHHLSARRAALPHLRERVLRHYRREARDLPWRDHPTPYRVWISEVMLQQTRVATATDYFLRWMARFPDVATLAAASEDDVLLQWQGLGYYSRARNLLRCARTILERHDGVIPSDPDALLALPGIGAYTAGAIASIAFGLPEPIVDGNVRRVFARAFDIDSPADARETGEVLWALAGEWARHDDPSAVNQALMEFGATVCTPRVPRCVDCPAADLCLARQRDVVHERPVSRPRRPPRIEHQIAWVFPGSTEPQVLLVRETSRRRFGGLWAPPLSSPCGDTPRAILERDFPGIVHSDPIREHAEVRHILTHRDLRARVLSVDLGDGERDRLRRLLEQRLGADNVGWFDPDSVALSRFARRIVAPFRTSSC